MKLQFGLLNFDQRPASTQHLKEPCEEQESDGAQIRGTVVDGPLLMAYRGHCIAPEENFERQPYRLGPYILTWDGRLDNREELAVRLGVRQIHSTPDPMIVLGAFVTLGDEALSALIGEFALTLFCKNTRTIKFVRSMCGARTLYYILKKDALTWSSSFAHLVHVCDPDLAVNEEYIVDYLVSQPRTDITPLSSVHAVPSNCLLELSCGRILRRQELWNPTRVSSLSYRDDKEYEEHLRSVVEDAVRARLRSTAPVFSELSGGLDSSTIVLVADQILKAQNRSADFLKTTSCVYEKSATCDESRFIQAIEEKRGSESFLVYERDQKVTLGLDDPQFTGIPNALHCFPGRYQTVTTMMQSYGARVLLTGRGGDHLFWSETDGSPLVADHLHRGRFVSAHRECLEWSHAASVPYLEVMLKGAVPMTVSSWLPARLPFKHRWVPEWLSKSCRDRLIPMAPCVDGYSSWHGSPSKRTQVYFLEHMHRYLGSGFLQEYSDIYASHPYSHRPLVEFCLAAPINQFLRNGETRSLMRRAFRHILPNKTVKRRSKGLLDELIARAVRENSDALTHCRNWQVVERGFVDSAQLKKSLLQANLGLLVLTGSLLRLFSLERWFRSLSRTRIWKHSSGIVRRPLQPTPQVYPE